MIKSHSLLFSDFDTKWYKNWARELKQDRDHLAGHKLKANKFWQNAVMVEALYERGMLEDGKPVAFVILQLDGNLVMYDRSAHPIWNSGTAGRPNLRTVIQQDGNVVLYNTLNQPFWSTGTAGKQ